MKKTKLQQKYTKVGREKMRKTFSKIFNNACKLPLA